MGGIWIKRGELVSAISEKVGYKSGLALTLDELQEHLPEFKSWWNGDPRALMLIRSEEFEQAVGHLLYRIGAARAPWNPSPIWPLFEKYRHDPDMLRVLDRVVELMCEVGPYDLTPLIERSENELGTEGLLMALELIDSTMEYLQQNAFTPFRRVEWSSVLQLKDLFESENLTAQYGHFIDQRFIDYLYRNFDAIDRINWRKFEGLVCEFFERQGFLVEIGEGRNDDGIDARVWPANADPSQPPAILIQCKRQKRSIDKVIVKALWADVVAEGAQSGLIVTTSRLSPGAQAVCTARAYPVHSADRETLRKWIACMRTPGTGVFLGE